ncbi:MAG TPA: transcriptional repressor LexA [Chloroflexi bacterium]|jgi:repressor LexA|nr:transcriptional repressor LexA [Chloroflexota bacterium]
MTQRSDLSDRQIKILEMIRDFMADCGYPPTIREIGEAVGISSTSVVSYNLDVLQRKGYLSRNREVSRGLRLVGEDDGEDMADADLAEVAPRARIPMLGVIAAGEPIPIPDSDFSLADFDSISISPDWIGDTEGLYALQVRGLSMIDALINDGDIVIMRHEQTAENGDMVAAWLKDEKATTLKHFYWERGRTRVRLQPANPTMEPIYVHPADLEIQGKVVGVIRRLN